MINEPAPAKLNLYLHITGRKADGMHELDSLVAFTGIGDEIKLEPAKQFDFTIEGPQAENLNKESADKNLAVKAAKSLAELTGKKLDVKITLIKNLPVASGIGGGSSDAAATLRALAKHWGLKLDDERLAKAAVQHGQDVPVCLKTENNYMTANGNEPAPPLPYADIVLVNPNKLLPTADVYKAYKESNAKFSEHAQLKEAPADLSSLITALKKRDNDLSAPAAKLMPDINSVLSALEKSGALITRMSGSGATCFALYQDRGAARKAASKILIDHSNWWVAQSYIPCRTDPRRY